MLQGMGDIWNPTLQDCETSWNPLVGAECILNGSIIQQVVASVGVTPSGIFPASTGTDESGNAVEGSNFTTIAIVALVAAAGYYYFKEMK